MHKKAIKPRVCITYDVVTSSEIIAKELPYVIGIIADLYGAKEEFYKRNFVYTQNIEHAFQVIKPSINIDIINFSNNKEENICLTFNTVNDFNPDAFLRHIPWLEETFAIHNCLHELINRLDGNHKLRETLQKLVIDKELQQKILNQESEALTNEILSHISKHQEYHSYAKNIIDTLVKVISNAKQNIDDILGFIYNELANINNIFSNTANNILQNTEFKILESNWRGLDHFFSKIDSDQIKVKIFDCAMKELINDLGSPNISETRMFSMICGNEYGTFGGEPFSCMILDYYFSIKKDDMLVLNGIGQIAAASHMPVISSVHCMIFNIDSFHHLHYKKNISSIFSSEEFKQWETFRAKDYSKYIGLTMPRFLLRAPYNQKTASFDFEEKCLNSAHIVWGNAAYALGGKIAEAYSLYGWTAAIRGITNGGVVDNLPIYKINSHDSLCSIETYITDAMEKELSDLGFIPLCQSKGQNLAVFFGSQTCYKPPIYEKDRDNANARLATQLPYTLNISRFVHYIKMIMREKIGSFSDKDDITKYLNNWIAKYVLLNSNAPNSTKAKYPLKRAKIELNNVADKPGVYEAVIYIQPHFQLEELSASIRLIAELETKGDR